MPPGRDLASDLTRVPPGERLVRQPPRSYRDFKRGAWIGGFMDVSPTAGKKVAVSTLCGGVHL